MDLIDAYKKKLARFRIKELKDVLTQLGVTKQGKKQDLTDRILTLLSDEVSNEHGLPKKKISGKGVAEIIDDAYRKLQGAGATSALVNGEPEIVLKPKEVKNSVYLDKKIRCLCGSSALTESMIQCADPQCLVLQHISCVIIPEEYSEGIPPIPSPFYCEICRINRADPFRVTVTHPLSPVKLIISDNPADGTSPLQNVEKTFQLTRADIDLLHNTEYDVQAWCILLNDKVPFRMQWPLYADLKVNGVPVRTVNRPGSQLLGANGRDDGPMIAFYIGEEINQISLSGCDARSFCLGVRIVRRCTIQQILNLILKEKNDEPFEDALARVRCCIGGGMFTANEDSDGDLEVISDCVVVNMRCPMSGSRIKTAGRFRRCAHIGCFDLETFVQINQRSRKWQCPICLKNYSLEDITVDPYFNRITKMLQDCGEDVTEIEVKPDGSWRMKNRHQFENLKQWHLPDGSICVSAIEIVSKLESRQLKEEGIVGHINPNQVRKTRDMQTSCRNQLGEYIENCSQNIITMSSSSSESHRADEDYSVNQDGNGHFDISANNGYEVNNISYNMNTTAMNENTNAALENMDVIILSDSEEENANLTSPETLTITRAIQNGGHSLPAAPAIFNTYPEDPALHAGPSSLDLFNSNVNDFEKSHQACSSGTVAGPQFQLFHTDDVSDSFFDPEHTPATSSAPIYGYELNSKCTGPGRQVFGSSSCYFNTEISDSLLSNPLASVCVASPVQTLPPIQPESDLGNNPQASNDLCGDNLTFLGLDNNSGGGNRDAGPATSNGLDFINQFESNKALLPPRMNDEVKSNGATFGNKSNGPFSFPRQPRSARRPHRS
ncbi:E3 SUMO-protein like [Actinidia chinensis var. chinensis]|uniref:E3 SUMO-protein like n=1 Tax=Actinidia chinensis var. chinensis TaxID=1590841 RepID=A0A2R6PL19_ACTCC|nr:E3 SUMO-protein like [Actinidia chinensis var. chinensis]